MKKRVLSGLFALALLATAGFGVNKSMKSNADLSDLALSNVEALAQGESGGGSTCSVKITCLDGAEISCSGTSCRYTRDESHTIGYVCCDDNYTYCQG
ncbi:NVEALA domain-containing protein [Proteiniphilum sp. X52]|uniref:NVEALA domain-containing protein n=1 Tax=Proteiniphilum sp. X52 TaxID=2382159 RepID=UPI000F09A4FB|nr:NVEALA domain-containing protein [Proteiniphilum sp. X52]RNC63259.1 hypothetical protein D7D25_17480 [Proteiniphilum sp. X52]